jgi:hypothetical protein
VFPIFPLKFFLLMKNITIGQYLLIFILIVLLGWMWMRVAALEERVSDMSQPSLYLLMNQMQDQAHKLSYSIDNENIDLADFYVHELEEAAEEMIEADLVYSNQPVGELTRTMLYPVIEELEDALESGNWQQVRDRYRVLIRACNNCHVSTGYDSIIIKERSDVNPYNQDFSVK